MLAREPEQRDMFGKTDMPPYVRGSDTSAAAAKSMATQATIMRDIIEAFVKNKRWVGATCDEIEKATKMRHQTASARIRQLVKMGRLKDSTFRRPTRSGRKATVWLWVAGPGIEPGTSGT